MKFNSNAAETFESRHNGPDTTQIASMLKILGVHDLDQLMDETIPQQIRLKTPLDLPEPLGEHDFLDHFKKITTKNKVYKSYIGLGYYNCFTPTIIQRNILENPGWYTAYTPYQAEISQGRMEALVNYQTMVSDLTGMDLTNASLLDEGTAAAEAMNMLFSLRKGNKKNSCKFLVDKQVLPQTADVLKTRSKPIGIQLVFCDPDKADLNDPEVFGLMIQYPDVDGVIKNHSSLVEKARSNEIKTAFCADLLSLTLLTPPGEMGADVVVGTTQRFGVPMGFGGPHAAYFATREEYKRQIPGRIIGISMDANGNKAYRMALQTREQHIKREKATSNICTAQVLLAVMSGMYGVYHGPEGLISISTRIHSFTGLLELLLDSIGYKNLNEIYFDTLKIKVNEGDDLMIKSIAEESEINLRYSGDNCIGISLDETTKESDVIRIANVFATASGMEISESVILECKNQVQADFPEGLSRTSDFMTHPVFHSYRSEHEMLRYIKSLENKDLSLVHSMISLGSCTMKLNATTEMLPVTWPELANIHPYAPVNQTLGYQEIFNHLETWLSEITGFPATSLQPNSGAQGEFSGLMVIRAYQESIGKGHRDVTIIPSSAHGTNPASAIMAGTRVVIVKCDDQGNIDVGELRLKAEEHRENLSALMVTYPSTHGVFEEKIKEICDIIHENGGQVYMDGANMNAQVGFTSPAEIGADVCHLNLHKTFSIPHGGGGPGIGPICVAEHLTPFLPGNPLIKTGGDKAISAVSAAPWGSAGVLAISYAYIRMMGTTGLTNATKLAILNANYIKLRLENHFPILYTGTKGRCAHEMIVDCREFHPSGIEVDDIAKRLMDYGFHAPTVSFPVPGTLMVEPTESESKEELDRFCDALIHIRKEIQEIVSGEADAEDNVLKNAPHTLEIVTSDNWNHAYSREKAVYPLPFVKKSKFWPAVSRIDNAYGDRNLFCSCVPVENYTEPQEIEI